MITYRINTQQMDDNAMFDWLVALMTTNINFSSNLTNSNLLAPLKQWIFKKTSCLFRDNQTSLGNRIFYIVNDLHELPHCKTCGKALDVQFTAYDTIYKYKNSFCSSHCAVSDLDVRRKIEKTTFDRHGWISSFEDPIVREKIKKSNLDKYGVEYPLQSKEITDKIAETNLDRYGCKSPFGSKEVQAKSKQTWMKNYGVDNPFKSPDVQEQIKATLMENYGVDSPFKSKEIYHKGEMTRLDKYGSTSYLGTEDCLMKTKEWSMNTYGVDHHFKAPAIRKEIEETNLKTYGNKAGKAFGTQYFKDSMMSIYGVEYTMQSKEIFDKAHYRYLFDSKSFDSAPEIAFYIYLKDNNMQFEYQPDVSFDYSFNGKVHRYFPDFKVEDKLYEIKGDHFFKDSKMVCPYRDKSWTDEQYLLECARYEAKHQCMLVNNVIILTSKDYRKYIDYVENAYGKDFLKQFKNQSING